MNILFGAIITVVSAIGFLGQLVSVLRPEAAQKLGLMERESEVDPAFFADVKGEAVWDSLILWMLPLAGILLMMNLGSWAYFGLIGGGMFLYFSGRGIIARITLIRRNIRIGSRDSLIGIFVFLTLWGLVGIFAIILAAAELG